LGGAGAPAGFSINESGQVAFEYSFGANGSSVHLGPNSLFGRLIGTECDVRRRVAFAHIDRDALNSTGQIAVWIIFDNGTEMIARGDPVRLWIPFWRRQRCNWPRAPAGCHHQHADRDNRRPM